MKIKWIQKIDTFMGYGFKFLCFAVVFAIFFGFASSCFAVSAKALSVEDQLLVEDYLSASEQRKGIIEYDYNADEDGNRSVHLSIMGLQNLALQAQTELYNDLTISGTTSISGHGASGFYRVVSGGELKVCNVFAASGWGGIVSTSDDWNVTINVSDPRHDRFRLIEGENAWQYSYSYVAYFDDPSSSNIISLVDSKGYLLTSSNHSTTQATVGISCNKTSVPIVPQGYGLNNPICSYLSTYQLPEVNFDSSAPWEYYNDTLLPYIRDNYDIEDIDDYLYFPNGYDPGGQPAPIINNDNSVLILPPIIAGAGAIIAVGGVNFDVSVPLQGQLNVDGIQFQFPKNDNSKIVIDGVPYDLPLSEITIDGHSIEMPDNNSIIIDGVTFEINADGSLTIDGTNYPLPIGQPETMPPGVSDYVMYYEIPTLERINIVDATITKPSLDAYAGGMSLVWDSVGRILDASGYSAIIPILLAFAALYYLLFKVGGH